MSAKRIGCAECQEVNLLATVEVVLGRDDAWAEELPDGTRIYHSHGFGITVDWDKAETQGIRCTGCGFLATGPNFLGALVIVEDN